ncbi:MAG: hypothetical protein Q8R48_00155 [Candidatus Omnitrophota bacterium]|nr:hypothetical protein [Candidatus Omnitrophota bacterium]
MIELVITMLLLAVIATLTFDFYAYITRFSIKAENYVAATEFCAETLERLLSIPYGDVATGSDLLPTPNPLSKYPDTTRTWSVAETKWDDGQADSLCKTITVTVSWNDGAARNVDLSVQRTS